MSATTCPPWCDQKHEEYQSLETAPRGEVRHWAEIHLEGDEAAGAFAEIEMQVRWRTDPDTGQRAVNVSDPGICLSPYFSEVYLGPPEIAELLQTVGKAQRRLALIHSHNR